jgi:hypothetical protein
MNTARFSTRPWAAAARAAAGFLLLLLAMNGRGQQALENVVFTAGTVTRDSAGRDWAYVLWQTTEPALLRGKTLALYAKPGAPSAAGNYARKAIVALHQDPLVLAPILNRAASVGDNITELDASMSALFQKILPAGLLTPAEKLSAIIRGSLGDPEHENNLQLLARFHPGVAMALGMAHAEPIGAGLTTFELRQFDAARGQDAGVVGRVTVEAGHAVLMPAPSPPVAVPEVDDNGNPKPESAKGELNVKLRWATPDALRRLSILNYGFNVYRITKTFAEAPANNFHLTPPDITTLLTLAGSNTNVHRLNQAPILKTRDFDPGGAPGQVADFISGLRDLTTYFMADDNDRFLPGGRPFVDGEQYYYFVTARDILGRDGLVSAGTRVTVCKRMPPLAPKGLNVVNDYKYAGGAGQQALMLVWPQNAVTTEDPITEYWVYRWTSVSNMQANEANLLANRIAIVPHLPGLEKQTNLDLGLPGSPILPADASRTFWYSVRAVNLAACGPLASGNSAPAYGVLRDREGPGSPTGYIEINCVKPAVRYVGNTGEPSNEPLDNTRFYYRLECHRTAFEIAWAEFYALLSNGSNYLGRTAFFGSDPTVSVLADYPRPISDSPRFFCRVGLNDGQVSDYAFSTQIAPPVTGIGVIAFVGDVVVSTGRVGNTPGGTNDPCVRHTPIPPGGGGTVAPGPCLNVSLHPKTRAWKVYRRIDDGNPTLIKTGTNGPSLSFNFCDDAPPANLADGCYYVQAFDENGNVSPMALLGCVQIAGTTPIPVPVLSTISQASNEARMNLRWFCTPHAVERFEVGIAAWDGGKFLSLPSLLSTQLSMVPNAISTPLVVKGVTNTYTMDLRRTPQIGPALGTTGPVFTVSVPIDTNVEYTVFVRALGNKDTPGTNSNVQQFKWSPTRLDQPEVPWPARDLPSVTSSFHPGIRATQLRDVFDGLAVRIGRVRADLTPQELTNRPVRIPAHTENPLKWVYTNNPSGGAVLPLVLYRCQVPNVAYPNVSGDVTQVSPLMEQIAYSTSGGAVFLHDPFIRLWREPNVTLDYDLYLVDTQPVVIGARYKYMLVRFKPNHEIEQVITTNEVEVQP